MSAADVRRMESVLADSWPAAENAHVGGWRLGFSKGVTRRANSALPLGSLDARSVDQAIDTVEVHYRQRGLDPCFKMTRAALPRRLSKDLDNRGYTRGGHSLVLVGALDVASIGEKSRFDTAFLDEPEPAWTNLTWPDDEYSDATGRRSIATHMPTPRAFALIAQDDHPVGAAAATVVDGWAVICALRVAMDLRRQGIGLALMEALRSWSLSHNARGSVLQVETGSLPARRLYAKLGMRLAYSYHYRIQAGDGDSKQGPLHGR